MFCFVLPLVGAGRPHTLTSNQVSNRVLSTEHIHSLLFCILLLPGISLCKQAKKQRQRILFASQDIPISATSLSNPATSPVTQPQVSGAASAASLRWDVTVKQPRRTPPRPNCHCHSTWPRLPCSLLVASSSSSASHFRLGSACASRLRSLHGCRLPTSPPSFTASASACLDLTPTTVAHHLAFRKLPTAPTKTPIPDNRPPTPHTRIRLHKYNLRLQPALHPLVTGLPSLCCDSLLGH